MLARDWYYTQRRRVGIDTAVASIYGRHDDVDLRARQTLKDVHLMLAQAAGVRQRLPLLEVHADVLEACVRQGDGDLDNSAVIKEIRRRRQP